MDWSTFVSMPRNTKKAYLGMLCYDKKRRLKDAAKMFGITAGGLSNWLAREFPGWHPFAGMSGQKAISDEWLSWLDSGSKKEPEVDFRPR